MESLELKGIDEDEQKAEGSKKEWFEKRIEEFKSEVEEMKRKRMEDMKANEKVLVIFASKEEAWKREKKKLMQELDALREIEKCNNSEDIIQAYSNKVKNEDNSKDHHESSANSKTPTMDEMMLKHAKEVHQRKLAYSKYVAVISELKGQKEKVENMLRSTVVEMGAWKRDAVMKAKEKKLVDATLRKVTDEIMRLQKEMDEKDIVIAQINQKEFGGNRVRDSLETELRAKELELFNAKMLLQQYTDWERNREREMEKWKRLYLGIKLELDNRVMDRQSSGLLLENEHNSKGETHRSSSASRNSKRGEEDNLEKKQLLQEIEAKNMQLQKLRRQLTNMEKEMVKKDKTIEFLTRKLSNEKEDKVEAKRKAMPMKMLFLARSKSCNSDSKIITRQKTRKNHDSKTRDQKVPHD